MVGSSKDTQTGVFEGLDMLAAIATQELQSNADEKRDVDGGNERRGRGTSVQPKKLAELDLVSMDQISAMSGNTLVKIFTETDFDEIKRIYSYSCFLIPSTCQSKFQSFGSETKAQKQVQKHLEKHVDSLVREGKSDFTAEPIAARKKRLQDNNPPPTVKHTAGRRKDKLEAINILERKSLHIDRKPVQVDRKQVQGDRKPIQLDRKVKEVDRKPISLDRKPVLIEKRGIVEKENSNVFHNKRRKEDLKPLLSDIGNEPFSNSRVRVKREPIHDAERKLEQPFIKQEIAEGLQDSEVEGTENKSIDEDHCYAQRFTRVKYERIDEFTVEDEEAGTESENTQNGGQSVDAENASTIYYSTGIEVQQEDLASIQAIEGCEVIIDGALVDGDLGVTVELVSTSTPDLEDQNCQEVIVEGEEMDEEDGARENEVIEWTDNNEFLYYTEEVEDKATYDNRKLKNKRTVAAVSSEDKTAALAAMEELRCRGATTEDLVCRLCRPPRPFTAYSTLLTHYRSHAGLRPFECSICQATFTRQHSLNYHLMTHANKTRFTCPHCNRKFRHPTHYKEHVKKHGEVVQFCCSICETSVSTQSHFRKHLKAKHNKTIDIMGNIIDWPQDGKERVYRKKKKVTAEEKAKKKEEMIKNTPEMFEEIQMVNTSTGTVLYQTGDIYASDNGKFYQVDKDQLRLSNQPSDSSLGSTSAHIPPMVSLGNQLTHGSHASFNSEGIMTSSAQTVQSSQILMDAPSQNELSNSCSPMIFVVPNTGKPDEEIYEDQLVVSLDSSSLAFQSENILVHTSNQTQLLSNQTLTLPNQSQLLPNLSPSLTNQLKTFSNQVQALSNQEQPMQNQTELNGNITQYISNNINVTQNSLGVSNCTVQTIQASRENNFQYISSAGSLTELCLTDGLINNATNNGFTSNCDDSETVVSPVTGQPIGKRKMSIEEVIENELMLFKESPTETPVSTNAANLSPVEENSGKISILERALTEVFPANVRAEDRAQLPIKSDDESEGFEFQTGHILQNSDDSEALYNPKKSPLKNRNEILCDILGIRG